MILYVMRHGIAEDVSTSGRDLDRALTDRGRDLVRRVAGLLSKQRSAPLPRILSSPATRAHQTALLVREIAGGSLEVDDRLGPDAGCDELPVALARELALQARDAMLVGHQPWVERLVHALVDDASRLQGVSTATIAVLQHDEQTLFRLVDVLRP